MNKIFIIAEAGVNHNGSIDLAKELIDVAKASGADCVKFQSFKAKNLASRKASKAKYQLSTTSSSESHYDMLKSLELSIGDHLELIAYSLSKGIQFFSTAFDVEGLDFLESLGFNFHKIPSGEITNYPYLVKLSEIGKPVIMSTGMATVEEIESALEILLKGIKLRDITVLHCNTEYPTPFSDVNLKAMNFIQDKFNLKVGYSDHTLGIEVPIAAVALGATVIEKHFTLSRSMNGPDHAASLEPNELKNMVDSIRNIELALSGDGIKKPSESELKNKIIARKSIHVNKDVPKGNILKEEDLITLRPGNGISPMLWKSIIGRKVVKDLKIFDILTKDSIE